MGIVSSEVALANLTRELTDALSKIDLLARKQLVAQAQQLYPDTVNRQALTRLANDVAGHFSDMSGGVIDRQRLALNLVRAIALWWVERGGEWE